MCSTYLSLHFLFSLKFLFKLNSFMKKSFSLGTLPFKCTYKNPDIFNAKFSFRRKMCRQFLWSPKNLCRPRLRKAPQPPARLKVSRNTLRWRLASVVIACSNVFLSSSIAPLPWALALISPDLVVAHILLLVYDSQSPFLILIYKQKLTNIQIPSFDVFFLIYLKLSATPFLF